MLLLTVVQTFSPQVPVVLLMIVARPSQVMLLLMAAPTFPQAYMLLLMVAISPQVSSTALNAVLLSKSLHVRPWFPPFCDK